MSDFETGQKFARLEDKVLMHETYINQLFAWVQELRAKEKQDEQTGTTNSTTTRR